MGKDKSKIRGILKATIQHQRARESSKVTFCSKVLHPGLGSSLNCVPITTFGSDSFVVTYSIKRYFAERLPCARCEGLICE